MLYALAVTIATGLLLLALLGAGVLIARRAAGRPVSLPVAGGRWYPSPLGLLLVLPLLGLLAWRFLPVLLIIPLVLPFFWRRRRLASPVFFIWNLGRRQASPDDGRDGDDDVIPGEYRSLDDD